MSAQGRDGWYLVALRLSILPIAWVIVLLGFSLLAARLNHAGHGCSSAASGGCRRHGASRRGKALRKGDIESQGSCRGDARTLRQRHAFWRHGDVGCPDPALQGRGSALHHPVLAAALHRRAYGPLRLAPAKVVSSEPRQRSLSSAASWSRRSSASPPPLFLTRGDLARLLPV